MTVLTTDDIEAPMGATEERAVDLIAELLVGADAAAPDEALGAARVIVAALRVNGITLSEGATP